MIGFMFAAVDTTASAMLAFVLNMCRYPEIQDRAFEHIKSVLGEGAIGL